MSTQNEPELEPVPELESVDDEKPIEETEESEPETISSMDENEIQTDDEILDELDDDSMIGDFGETDIDRLGGLLSSVLVTEEGETICSVLGNISRQLEIHNKIMIKILSHLQKGV